MTLTLGIVDYVIIGLMLAVSATFGIYFRFTGGRQKTTDEFLMAGRNMAILPVSFSLMATYMSAISVLGIPAEVYMYGTQFTAWVLGLPIGSLIAGYMFLPIFFDMEACTAYEYLERRFGKTTRALVSILFTLQMILYMAVVLYAPSLALNAVTGLSTWTSVISLAVVCTFYCSLGGLKAVLWTDVFQSLLMYVTIISIVVKASIDIGGMKNIIDIAGEGGRLIFNDFSLDLTKRYTFWNGTIYGIIFAISIFGTNQAQIQRLLSVRSLERSQRALLLSVPLIIIFTLFCFWDGIVIYSTFHDCDPMLGPSNTSINSPDQLVPFAILRMFGGIPGLSGLCICGVFGASLSTISSAMNSLTAVTMEDFIRPYCFCKKLTEAWAAFMAKIIAIAFGGVCLLLTILVANFRGVLEASNVLFGMIGGPVLGVFSLGMFTTTANEQGTLLGLLVGFAFNAWLGFGSYSAKVKISSLSRNIEGCQDFYNETFNLLKNDINSSTSVTTKATNFSSDDENDENVLAIYRLSYMWFPVIGALVVLTVGYISSFVIGCWIEKKDVKEILITPAFRKWFFHSENKGSQELQVKKEENGEEKQQHAEINLTHHRNHLTSSFAL